MKQFATIGSALLLAMLVSLPAFGEAAKEATAAVAPASTASNVVNGVVAAPVKKEIKPYRTFITLQRYNMEQSGDVKEPIANVRIDVVFPNGEKMPLPGGTQYWPIGNGQVQEINRTFELPWQYVQNDGFKFKIQMIRKGSEFLPCEFDVVQLSEFNRSYVCHTDLGWQNSQKIPAEKQDKEGIQVRVFTDLNSKPKELPTDSLALK